VFIGLGGLLALGAAPSVASGGMLLVFGFRQQAWSVGLEARGDFPAGADLALGHATTSAITGMLRACVHFHAFDLGARRVDGSGCFLVGGGAVFASGQGFDQNLADNILFIAVGARGGLEVPLRRPLALLVHGDLIVPTTNIHLVVNGVAAPVWQAPPVSGALGVALLAYFR
jgi:hypothetical protein